MTVRIKRDTASDWTAANIVLADGQLGYETDTGRVKVGNGATAWNSLAYRFEGGATNLGYTASTRLLTSSTGADVTLPLVTSADAGLAPASGGGTTNFLRADGTWAAPGGTSGLTTVTVPNNALEWSQTVTATGVTVAQRIMLTVGAHGDADENTAEMLDIAAMSATPGTGQITLEMSFATPAAGAIKINWMAV